jgi:hypothetical protein
MFGIKPEAFVWVVSPFLIKVWRNRVEVANVIQAWYVIT